MWLLLNSANQWVRTNLTWSNSAQSWRERVGSLILLLAAIVLVWQNHRLSLVQAVLLWALWGVTLAILSRRGWLKLFGPVLFYDMLCISRRNRYYILRGLYVIGLFFFVTYRYWMWTWEARFYDSGIGIPPQMMTEFATSLFNWFIVVQITVVVLMTPAYVAGAIADEKDRKTLEFLLATDLRNREIVLSKLMARSLNILLIVLAGLPVLSFLQFMGGVDPELVLAGFAATGLLLASIAGISILCSVQAKKPRDAIILTYLTIFSYHFISFLTLIFPAAQMGNFMSAIVVGLLTGAGVFLLPSSAASIAVLTGFVTAVFTYFSAALVWLLDAFNAGNFVIGLFKLNQSLEGGGSISDTLGDVLGSFALFNGTIAVVCSGWAVIRLRKVALKEAHGSQRKVRWGLRWFSRPPIGNQPMVWKEVFAEPGMRLNWLGRIIITGLVLLSFVPVAFILYYVLEESPGGRRMWEESRWAMNWFVRIVGTLVACLALLGVAVRAAGSLSGERDRQTFDGLLTTPMDSTAILFGKWAGSVASARWILAWLAVIWLLGVVTGGVNLLAVPFFIGSWVIYAGVFACIGLWFSLVSRTTLMATIWTLLTTILIGGMHWFCTSMCCIWPMAMATRSGKDMEYILKFLFGQTPPLVMGLFVIHGDEFKNGRDGKEIVELIGFSLVGLGIWAVGGLILANILNQRFRELTLRIPLSSRSRWPNDLGRPPLDSQAIQEIPSKDPHIQVDSGAIQEIPSKDPHIQEPPGDSIT